MSRTMSSTSLFSIGLLTLALAEAAPAALSGFDDLSLVPNSFYVGNPQAFPGGTTTFTSGPASYAHTAVDYGFGFTAWSGWAYSNVVDTSTAGFGNQYASYAGGGAEATSNYVVAYASDPITLSFSSQTALAGAYFSNTTYAALSILNGDAFSKQFSLAEDDFFELTIEGLQGSTVTHALTLALADYRGATAKLLDTWQWLDLSGLGAVDGLRFSLTSSDVGAFGMNTPAYFAMDGLTTVPVPAAAWLMLSALSALSLRQQRRLTLKEAN